MGNYLMCKPSGGKVHPVLKDKPYHVKTETTDFDGYFRSEKDRKTLPMKQDKPYPVKTETTDFDGYFRSEKDRKTLPMKQDKPYPVKTETTDFDGYFRSEKDRKTLPMKQDKPYPVKTETTDFDRYFRSEKDRKTLPMKQDKPYPVKTETTDFDRYFRSEKDRKTLPMKQDKPYPVKTETTDLDGYSISEKDRRTLPMKQDHKVSKKSKNDDLPILKRGKRKSTLRKRLLKPERHAIIKKKSSRKGGGRSNKNVKARHLVTIIRRILSNRKQNGKKDFPISHKRLEKACNQLAETHVDIALVYAVIAPDKTKGVALLCLTTENLDSLPTKHDGFSVIQKPFNTESPESLEVEKFSEKYTCDKVRCKEIDETIDFHAESLMMKHSNLEAIKMSLVRSTKTGIIPEHCIVFVCRCKAYIPFGESDFPKLLSHPTTKVCFSTDVREGCVKLCSSLTRKPHEWNQELAMGCSIGPENDGYSASLGPFVNIKETNELCFLTVRHLFQPLDISDRDLSGRRVVQPADSENVGSMQRSWSMSDRHCGIVEVANLDRYIDAVLVKIEARAPHRGNFVGIKSDDLDFTGFANSSYPRYDDGCSKDARNFAADNHIYDRIIKIGKTTGLTKGTLRLASMAVRIVNATGEIQHGGRIQTKNMFRQLQVDSSGPKAFFEEGDSGSAVFLADRENKLHCIGMAIGTMTDRTCIVTPIQTILQTFSLKLRKTLELKKFSLERMDHQ